jgi:transposase
MRGEDIHQQELFSYSSLEARVPSDHPLRPIRVMVDEALKALDGRFNEIYGQDGRRSIPPERLLRALLLQMLYSVRSERMLIKQLEYNLLFRWFVGLSANEPVWHPTVFTKNRDLLSDEHFTVDGTMIEAWAGQKSFQRKKDGSGNLELPPPPDPGSNPSIDFRQQKRSNQTHESLTDRFARLFKKACGAEAKLCYLGHVVTETRTAFMRAPE